MPDSAHNRDEPDLKRRGRETVFIEKDEAMLSLALQDAYPDITFISDRHEMYGGRRPCASIALSDSRQVWANVARGWAPDFYLHIWRSSWEWGRGSQGFGRWAWDPPTLETGSIFSSYMPEDDAARIFVRQVWRIIERIATNRVTAGNVLGNQLMGIDTRLMANAKGGLHWCGHQALAWAREGGNRRMLYGAVRPCDDWEIPRDKWYQELMRRAMQTEAWNAKTLENSP